MVVIDLGGAHAEPGGDPTSRVVYACRPSDVKHVLLDGEIRVRDREIDLDEEQIIATARVQGGLVKSRAGL
jgi:5-methylthioadenosine/S-adenosylhomocysteine deaminase